MKKKVIIIAFALTVLGGAYYFFSTPQVKATEFNLDIKETAWEIRAGLTTNVWSYGGTVPGMPIVVKKGDTVRISGINNLPTSTNIHWHGLVVPNDQDGPGKTIEPGKRFTYSFKVNDSGTYWYHSHYRPVLDQVDNGLYAPFIIKAPEDDLYSGDHVLVLDDWYLDAKGNRLQGTARGDMERFGNVETVNGKTDSAIEPLVLRKGELHKLRFINASTAAVHTIKISGHKFRVTHTDGHPLAEPYETDTITLSPAERIDAEVAAVGEEEKSYLIESERSELGIKIPINYQVGQVSTVLSPFVPPQSIAIPEIDNRTPDYTLTLNSVMDMAANGQSSNLGGGHDMTSMPMPATESGAMDSMMRWTINGKSYPDTYPIAVKLGEVVKLRLWNKDVSTAEEMDHPIHIHGTAFQIVSLNGSKPERETWKDTVNVPAGEYVDIAFTMTNPGTWMLHCHILDHEDGGMMTSIVAK
ncbi:multicopper oxidase family protein [Desulfosporosinus lacus]|uniref:Multicopper oxidase with three cupredoxin domains (Includes cell division protein FtsP and spore coat protein CotA) n=1 Tax=Desulfosporosinus lacus DSM 15449 TaxID=1121420 RepID=A0A1M5QCD8_9FIRM|nr:multicopper oxidase family protein [Desulfosporosinus lacus]SHH11672.1 Multicopper oxidase with three cupredoxin domains (includes cell division protein FtsP and spore coat protein CotA) [Desulfosporosinus lacus DSM 15449]